jgi:hypothetical protein
MGCFTHEGGLRIYWYNLGMSVPLRDVPREVAEEVFARLMEQKAARCAALEAMAVAEGVEELTPLGMGAWLREKLAGADDTSDVAVDVSLWLGERIISRAPHLRWELYVGVKKSTGYQRAVLVGFMGVDDARYYVDVAHFVSSWCELCARRRMARADFLATIEATTLRDA